MLAGDAARIPDGLIAWIPAEARLPDRERNRARARSRGDLPRGKTTRRGAFTRTDLLRGDTRNERMERE